MGTPVTMLVVDPVRGFQREIESGETPVDGDGNAILYPGLGPPVADIPALKALLPARRVDQQVRLVEDADPNTPGVDYPSNYAWDAESTDPDDPGSPGRPPAIVLPDDAPATGRWIRAYSEVSPHHEIHELGGRDEIMVEDLPTQEFSPGSSSSSPGPNDPIKVLVPDGGGGLVWYDLLIEGMDTNELDTSQVLQPDGAGGVTWVDLTVEDMDSAELDPNKVLQPDGAGGVVWSSYDPVIEGDLDMGCNDLIHLDAIYFCAYGSETSSSSGTGEPSNLWIRPDRTVDNKLIYHAPGGHRFESPVTMTGTLSMGANGIGRDSSVLTFLAGATGTATFTGSVKGTQFLVDSAGVVGLATNARFTFAAGSITVAAANLLMGANGIGNDGSVLTFANTAGGGHATFTGNVNANGFYVGDGGVFGIGAGPSLTFATTGSSITVSTANFFVGTNGIGRAAGTLTFDASENASFGAHIYLGANGIGNNEGTLTFTAAPSPLATFSGTVGGTSFYVGDGGVFGISAGPSLTFGTKFSSITVGSANILLGSNGIGSVDSVLTFSTTTATFVGTVNGLNFYVGDGGVVGATAGPSLTFGTMASTITVGSANLLLGANGIGNNASVLTFAVNGNGLATFGGDVTAANSWVPSGGAMGMSAKGRFVFADATPDTITVTDATFIMGAAEASGLTMSGNIAMATNDVTGIGNVYLGTGGAVGLSAAGRLVFTDAAPDTITVTDATFIAGVVTCTELTASGVVTLTSGFRVPIATKVNDYVMDADDHTVLADAAGGDVDVTLPQAAAVSGQIYAIKKIDGSANAVRISAKFEEDIDANQHYYLLDQWDCVMLQSAGSNWFVIGMVEGSLEPSSSSSM